MLEITNTKYIFSLSNVLKNYAASTVWLNTDERANDTWLEKLRAGIPDNRSLIVDESAMHAVQNKNKSECLAIIISSEDGMTVTLTSFDCTTKKRVVCSIDPSNLNVPQKLMKFPCIPNKPRIKRKSVGDTSLGDKKGIEIKETYLQPS